MLECYNKDMFTRLICFCANILVFSFAVKKALDKSPVFPNISCVILGK